MVARSLVALSVLVVAGLSTTRSVAAATFHLPAARYPPGSHVTFRSALSNQEMDCLWGFFCEGDVPLFHFETQDQLHRVSGWAQFAGWHHHGHTMAFQLFASRYADLAPIRWSARALTDLQSALQLQGYRLLRHVPLAVPIGARGGFVAEIQRSGDYDLVVEAGRAGSQEVEAIAMYLHRSSSERQTALTDLTLQVTTALQDGAPSPSLDR